VKLYYRPKFFRDIAREQTYLLENAGADIAERWYQGLRGSLQFIVVNPLVGRLRNELKLEGVRSWRVSGFERWTVFYTVDADALTFLRVVSGSMNLSVLSFN
jgi:plasmid stabilization system protein ParE